MSNKTQLSLPKSLVIIRTEHNRVYIGFKGNNLFGSNYYRDGVGGSQMIYDQSIIDIKIDEELLIKRLKLAFADEQEIGYLIETPLDHVIDVMNPFDEMVELIKGLVS